MVAFYSGINDINDYMILLLNKNATMCNYSKMLYIYVVYYIDIKIKII